MTTYTGPDRTFDAGVPAQWSDDFAVTPEGFITGEYPAQMVLDHPVAESQTLAAYTVVGFDASGNLVPALLDLVTPANTIKAIGVLMYPVTSGVGENPAGRVLRSACINPLWANLVWDASYDTDAKKMDAFEGAPSPTQIVTRPLASYTPVAP